METPQPAPDLLAAIVGAARRMVEVREEREPLTALTRRAEEGRRRRGAFASALTASGRVNVIAECKRRSPARGLLRPEYDPVGIARRYAECGAAAISVLTEPTFFDGSLEHLAAVRAAVDLPVLRKDFIISEYQLLEARAAGADAVLLIVGALDVPSIRSLLRRADELDLDALVEVHDEGEIESALAGGARMIGVNNRNLHTLEVDVAASERLIERLPDDVIAVSESGLRSRDDLLRLKARGYDAFLVGERFMSSADPGEALRQLCS